MKNVLITYPDNTSDVRTLEEQFAHFQDENPAWQANFYWALLNKELEVPTKYAIYSLTDEPVTK